MDIPYTNSATVSCFYCRMKLFFPIYSGVKSCNLTPKGQKCYKNAEGYFMRIPNISHFLSDVIFLIIKMIAHYEINTLQKWGHVT